MIITIHQPNFFPYYPFFQKMDDADIFVILTHCQFEKNNFQNRFNKDSKWYTMCVNKGLDPIYTKIYLSPEKDWKRIKDMLPEYKDVLNLFDDCVDSNLSKMNSNIILKIKNLLNIKTKIVFDYSTELKGTERLVDICIKNNATTYISGISGSKYMDLKLFSEKNIKVVFQDETKMVKKPIIDILKNKLLNV
jgi:hypothetical protein